MLAALTTPRHCSEVAAFALAVAAAALLLFGGMTIPCSYVAADKAEYELQERCGRRASKMFEKEYGNGFETTNDGYRMLTYDNNYNVERNKCYMVIKTTTHGRGNKTDPPYDVISSE